MGQIPAIKLNREFSLVYRKGKKHHAHSMILHVLPRRSQEGLRLGVAVSRSIRTAVERNRLKRLLRETFRLEAVSLKGGYDIILTAKDMNPPSSFDDIRKDLHYLLKRAALYQEREPLMRGNEEEK